MNHFKPYKESKIMFSSIGRSTEMQDKNNRYGFKPISVNKSTSGYRVIGRQDEFIAKDRTTFRLG